jgi:hypothetical protein
MKDKIIEEIFKHALPPLLSGLLLYVMAILFPLKKSDLIVPFNPIEAKKIGDKKVWGCFIYWAIIAVVLYAAKSIFWQPLYDFTHFQGENIVYKSEMDFLKLGLTALYLAAPLSMLFTNNWFLNKYGIDKVYELNSYYSITNKLDNYRLEKWLFNGCLILSFLVVIARFQNLCM